MRSENNVLCDFGTRQADKNFGTHVAAFLEIHHEPWYRQQLQRFPPKVARPELLPLIPRAEERQYLTGGVDSAELERIRARIARADDDRVVRMQQALATKSS